MLESTLRSSTPRAINHTQATNRLPLRFGSGRKASRFKSLARNTDTISFVSSPDNSWSAFFLYVKERITTSFKFAVEWLQRVLVGAIQLVYNFFSSPLQNQISGRSSTVCRELKNGRNTPASWKRKLEALFSSPKEKDQKLLEKIFIKVGEKRLEIIRQEEEERNKKQQEEAKRNVQTRTWNVIRSVGSGIAFAAVGAVRLVQPLNPLNVGKGYLIELKPDGIQVFAEKKLTPEYTSIIQDILTKEQESQKNI